MDEQEARRRERVRELLAPRGEPVGAPGRRRRVRVMGGGLDGAREFLRSFEELEGVGEASAHSYDGRLLELGGVGWIGLRERSGSGEPTIDVRVEYVPEIKKIKFV